MSLEASYTRYCLLTKLHVEPSSNVTFSFFVFYFFDKIREVKNKREKYPQIFDTFSTQLSITIYIQLFFMVCKYYIFH